MNGLFAAWGRDGASAGDALPAGGALADSIWDENVHRCITANEPVLYIVRETPAELKPSFFTKTPVNSIKIMDGPTTSRIVTMSGVGRRGSKPRSAQFTPVRSPRSRAVEEEWTSSEPESYPLGTLHTPRPGSLLTVLLGTLHAPPTPTPTAPEDSWST